jgi:hypothetical protein
LGWAFFFWWGGGFFFHNSPPPPPPTLGSDFNHSWNVSTNCSKTSQYQISSRSVQLFSSCYVRTGGQTDRAKVIGTFWQRLASMEDGAVTSYRMFEVVWKRFSAEHMFWFKQSCCNVDCIFVSSFTDDCSVVCVLLIHSVNIKFLSAVSEHLNQLGYSDWKELNSTQLWNLRTSFPSC